MAAPTTLLLAVSEGEQPNPLVPALYDIIWGTLCFVVLFVLFWKYVLPQVQVALNERTVGIEDKLAKAEQDRAEAETLLADYKQQLSEARSEASRIRTEAQADRKAIVDEARTEAQTAANQVLERSQAQLRAEFTQAKAELSRDVGRLAVDLAGRVVGENLSDTDRTRATVDRFIADLETAATPAEAVVGAGAGGAHPLGSEPSGPQ